MEKEIYVPEHIRALIREYIWTTASGLSLALNIQRDSGSMYTIPEITQFCDVCCPDLDSLLH